MCVCVCNMKMEGRKLLIPRNRILPSDEAVIKNLSK